MRCDASWFPRETLARKNSRADGLAARVGSRGGHGLLQLLLRAGNFPQVTPRSRPAGTPAPHKRDTVDTVPLSAQISRA